MPAMKSYSQVNESSLDNNQPEPKRRKVRKGTLSCWGCRRRKIRCKWSTETDTVCDGCQRRKTTCISQEFPDETDKLDGNQQMDNRITRLEAVIEQLATKIDVGNECRNSLEPLVGRNSPRESRSSSPRVQSSSRSNTVPIASDARIANDIDQLSHQEKSCGERSKAPLRSSLRNKVPPLKDDSRRLEKYDDISRKLVKAWPSQSDVKLITNVPTNIAALFHGTICAPYSTLLCQKVLAPQDLLTLPPPGSHPVLVARKLLLLATYLQSLPPSSIRELSGLSTNYRHIMSSAIETAHNFLSHNEELVDSIEGVECIIIESMYQNNAGNLRSSWHAIRRAMQLAQIMGLHRCAGQSTQRYLETETQNRIEPEYMWFRLNQSDRYLSMMLGLPQGSSSNKFAEPPAIAGRSSVERLQRLDCLIGSRILQRNEAGVYDLASTLDIDRLLQESSASMPPQWWLPINLPSSAGENMEGLEKIVRTLDHFTHYHLVTQLHLPYLLKYSEDREYDYNKITAINASREVLTRFVSFGGTSLIVSFCRGINFLAFIACTVICIAHMDYHRRRQSNSVESGEVLNSLAHQHSSDRGMMELALSSMESMAAECDDMIASKLASILTRLLSIEADASLFGNYITNRSEAEQNDLECGGKVSDGGRILHINIPYFVTVKFECSNGSKSASAVSLPSVESFSTTQRPGAPAPSPTTLTDASPTSELLKGHSQWSVDHMSWTPIWEAEDLSIMDDSYFKDAEALFGAQLVDSDGQEAQNINMGSL